MSDAISGFAFLRGDIGHEVQALTVYASRERIPWRFLDAGEALPDGWVPSGSVEWILSILGRDVPPDYAPDFLRRYLHRRTWLQANWPSHLPIFLKPADRFKRFPGFLASSSDPRRESGPFWCSEIVSFRNEWRYYVAGERVLAAHWYAGDELTTPAAPALDVQWPRGWCGAVDFGQLDTGEMALVESHAPFACGWYGSLGQGAIYAEWLSAGWRFLTAPNATL